MRLAAGLRPDPLGVYSAIQTSSRHKEGGKGGKGKERVVNREGEEGREWTDVKGFVGMGRGGG